MQAKCEARSILFGEDLAHITHCREDKVQSLAIRKQTLQRKHSQTRCFCREGKQPSIRMLRELPAYQSCTPFKFEPRMAFKHNCNSNVNVRRSEWKKTLNFPHMHYLCRISLNYNSVNSFSCHTVPFYIPVQVLVCCGQFSSNSLNLIERETSI